MGCKHSKPDDPLAAPHGTLARHVDDHGLAFLELDHCGIPEFDEVFQETEDTLNRLIELNNDCNDCCLDVRTAYTACVGGFQLELATNVPDHDVVLLDILQNHSSGSARSRPLDLQLQVEQHNRLQDADAQLQRALGHLHATLVASARQASLTGQSTPGIEAQQGETAHIQLGLSGEGSWLNSQPSNLPEVERFNACLKFFRTCLGESQYTVKLTVKACHSPGAPTVRARLVKPKSQPTPGSFLQAAGGSITHHVGGWMDEGDSATSTMVPITLLDVACSEDVDSIKQAEATLVHHTQRLANLMQGCTVGNWQVLRKHKVTMGVLVTDPDRRAAIRNTLVDINAALFQLAACGAAAPTDASQPSISARTSGQRASACTSAGMEQGSSAADVAAAVNGASSKSMWLAKAVGEVVRQLCLVIRKHWANKGGLPYALRTLLTATSQLSFKDVGTFEFGLLIDILPQAQVAAFPACLPQLGQGLWTRIDMLNGTISNALKALPSITAQIETLTEQARGFYDMVPEVAAQRGLTMMQAVKVGKAVGHNLDVLFNSQRLFQAFTANIKRISQDLATAQQDIEQVLAQQSAAEQSGMDVRTRALSSPTSSTPMPTVFTAQKVAAAASVGAVETATAAGGIASSLSDGYPAGTVLT